MKKLPLLAYPLVAALSLAAASVALADDITPDTTASHVFAQPKTRDQVQAELFRARQDGSVKQYSMTWNPLTAAQTTRSRAEVRSEAQGNGAAAGWTGEDSGSFALSRSLQRPARDTSALVAGRNR